MNRALANRKFRAHALAKRKQERIGAIILLVGIMLFMAAVEISFMCAKP